MDSASAQTRIVPTQVRPIQVRPSTRSSVPSVRRIIRRPTTRPIPSTTRSGSVIRSSTQRPSTPSNPTASEAQKPTIVKDEIPPAALLTDYGNELVERLKRLRYTESQLGSKHPSLAGVREQIEDVKTELKTWDVKDNETLDAKTQSRIAKLDEDELRLLVVRLSQDVAKLRGRVAELEASDVATTSDEEPKQTVSR